MNRKQKGSKTSTPPKRKKVKLSKRKSKRKQPKGNLKDDSDYKESSDSSSQDSIQDKGIDQDQFSQMNLDREDIEVDNEDVTNLEEQVDESNIIIKTYLHNIKNNIYNPNNGSYVSLNVIMICQKSFLTENKPIEDQAMKHYNQLKELNEDFLDWDFATATDVHDFRVFLWNALNEDFKSTAMLWIQEQLMQDLLRRDRNAKTPNPKRWQIDNFDDVLHWHGSIDGATDDEVAWRSK